MPQGQSNSNAEDYIALASFPSVSSLLYQEKSPMAASDAKEDFALWEL